MSSLIGAAGTDGSARSADLTRWPFVGRQTQLNAFAETLAARRSYGFVVCGPSGVGKSRLAEECLASAVRAGFQGAHAVASAAAAAMPLGAIAHLVPDGIDLNDPVSASADVAAGLKRRTRRVILWVDDLHLLDATTATLLRQLMDDELVRLIATVRAGEPTSDAVKALCLGASVHRVNLSELKQKESEQLLKAVLGGPVGRRTAQRLHARSGGNLLYLRELVRGAMDTGSLVHDGEVWRLSATSLSVLPTLTELVEFRLAAAGPKERPVLELLALCGPLTLDDAECVTSPAELNKLEKAGLIRTMEYRSRTAVTLVHPLYGEVLLKNTSVLRRRNLLRGQAQRKEALGAQRREDLLRIAIWRLNASESVDPDLLIQAATLSFHAHDYPQAVALLEALPDARHTTSTRVLLGHALTELGRWQSAESVLSVGDAHAADEQERLEVALARIMNLFWLGQETEKTLEVVDSALLHVTNLSGQRTLRIIEGYVRVISGQPDHGLKLLEEHMEREAETSHDCSTWLLGALMKTIALTAVGRTAEAMTWGKHAHDIHVRAYKEKRPVPHPATQLIHHAWTESGMLTESIATGEQTFRALMATAGTTEPRIWTAFLTGRAEWQAGHPGVAHRWFSEALAPARESQHLRALPLTLSYLAATAAVLGDFSTTESSPPDTRAYPTTGWLTGEEFLGEAWILAARGQTADARRVLTKAVARARAGHFFTSEILLLTDLARLGGAREATGRLSELAEFCDGAFTPARAHFASALAANDPDELMAAADQLEDLGADLLAAEAAAAAATTLRRLGESRMAAAARNRAAIVSGRCNGARTPLLGLTEATAALTAREREIAQLAAGSLTSKEIAEMLSLSARTVENHLQRAFTKLGITNRRDLRRVLRL
ncbi:LuxR C-terminal-related transcriptional regulator [Streptomyces sp. NBC_01077]|uniref:LuxR C-terminal-related transcriptional regulator n=1 Tax=Streptomyces sp. NBC_01077 TaxID=2903746 RepID=UPI003864F2B7|nr:LuxR C-terminal-related transcriptional regulator [Streptomyces sp. NBC_01077]WSV43702.1 LuxR C-terminal-related transcriptional regulator [Streptomyces sp. NBC_01077]